MTTRDSERLTEFLTTVAALSVEQFDEVRAAGRRLGPAPRIQARKAAKLSASEFSALDRQVRDAIQPRAVELNEVGDGALSAAINDALFAAHAVAYGARLTTEQISMLVGPFTSVGIAVPIEA